MVYLCSTMLCYGQRTFFLCFKKSLENSKNVFLGLLSDLTSLMIMTIVAMLARLKKTLEDVQVDHDFSSQDSNLKVRSLHFSWQKIALMLGVSERTVRRRRSELGMTVGQVLNYSEINDDELDVFVQHILHYSPNSGERMVIGALKGYGVKVQRERVRQSICRIDPVSRELRRRTAIRRRVYSVRTPNALWYEFLCVHTFSCNRCSKQLIMVTMHVINIP